MKQERKDLLLKYLCVALPYGVKLFKVNEPESAFELYSIDKESGEIKYYKYRGKSLEIGGMSHLFKINGIPRFKPYLRPISSMTEEEMDKLFDILHIDKDGKDEDWIKINDDLGIKFFFPTGKWIENVADAYDYLYSIHIDFRGLITKDLAIEVTEENNPYKE